MLIVGFVLCPNLQIIVLCGTTANQEVKENFLR